MSYLYTYICIYISVYIFQTFQISVSASPSPIYTESFYHELNERSKTLNSIMYSIDFLSISQSQLWQKQKLGHWRLQGSSVLYCQIAYWLRSGKSLSLAWATAPTKSPIPSDELIASIKLGRHYPVTWFVILVSMKWKQTGTFTKKGWIRWFTNGILMGVIAKLSKRKVNKLWSVCAIFMHSIKTYSRLSHGKPLGAAGRRRCVWSVGRAGGLASCDFPCLPRLCRKGGKNKSGSYSSVNI